ncbi:MAG: acyltransferase [Actinobacteria bacterium]|nr:acyltransferase [Actinomycetota bacterium]
MTPSGATPAPHLDSVLTVDTSAIPRPHFPGLEGMRAVAASLVVLTHATFLAGDHRSGWLAAPGRYGDAGVAIFFTLSGFLLYRPFVAAHLRGDRQLPALAFWWRRILRIFPCYWVALSVLWALHSFHPFGFVIGFDLGPSWWKYYLLLQIYIPALGQGGIAQSWSIATEISFYAMLPFWALGIRALSRRRPTPFALEIGGIGLLFVFGYLSRWWFSHFTALAVRPIPGFIPKGVTWRAVSFTWLPNQIDFFAIGMAVAVTHVWVTRRGIEGRIGRWTRWPTAWWIVSLGVYLTITYVLGDNTGDYKSGYWQARSVLYGLLGLTMLIPLVFGDQSVGLIRRFVTWKPIWWIGVVSYGFYLWHLNLMERLVTMPNPLGGPPIWHGVRGWRLDDANPYGLLLGAFVAGLGVAAVSWYAIEKPLLRFKDLVGGRGALRPDDRPDATDITASRGSAPDST